jgi:Holliday junction resolvase RusA-like endonuclease
VSNQSPSPAVSIAPSEGPVRAGSVLCDERAFPPVANSAGAASAAPALFREWRIEIPGRAVAWARARSNGKIRFTDPKMASAQNWIKLCAIDQVGQLCLTGPLVISVTATIEVPASWSQAKRQRALMGLSYPTGKPDLDNYCKLVGDALNGIVWADDAQIVQANIRKQYGSEPSTVLTVKAL